MDALQPDATICIDLQRNALLRELSRFTVA